MCLDPSVPARNRSKPKAKRKRYTCDLCEPRTLVAIRERAANDAAREALTEAYAQQCGSVVQIARVLGTDRVHVRRYLRRYGIGRYAKGAT